MSAVKNLGNDGIFVGRHKLQLSRFTSLCYIMRVGLNTCYHTINLLINSGDFTYRRLGMHAMLPCPTCADTGNVDSLYSQE